MKAISKVNPFSIVLIIFYLYIIVEGALRKWLLPGLATPLFFLKYVMAILLTVFFIINKNKVSLRDYPFIGFFFFFLFYCLLEIFNLKAAKSIMAPLVGIMLYFSFSILIFIIPLSIKKKEDIQKVLKVLNWILVPIFILGIIQYFSPPFSYINKYVNDDMIIAKVGNRARITTTFSYLATYAPFLGYCILLIFFQLLQIKSVNIKSIWVIVLFMFAITNAFMTGSRGVVFMSVLQIMTIFFIHTVTSNSGKMAKSFINACLFLVLSYIVISLNSSSAEAFDNFMKRVERGNDIAGRVESAFNPFKFLDESGLMGFGIGTTYQGNIRFVDRSILPGYFEKESERIMLEIGIIGFIILFVFRLSVFIYSLKTFFNTRDAELKLLVLILLVIQIPEVLVFNQTTFNYMANIVYWTSIGMLVSINRISVSEKAAKEDHRIAAG
jgi:hypothetical protein